MDIENNAASPASSASRCYHDDRVTVEAVAAAMERQGIKGCSVAKLITHRRGQSGKAYTLLTIGLIDASGEPCAVVRQDRRGRVSFFWSDSWTFKESSPVVYQS